MKIHRNVTTIVLTTLLLSGCLASTSSPDGVACDFSTGKPVWELPLVCQPNGG